MESSSGEKSGRDLVLGWWEDAWNEGLWAAAWGKSVEGLTPEQAAWQPLSRAPGGGATSLSPASGDRRHSIWQIVLHVVFWRQVWLRKLEGGAGPSKEELAISNFPDVAIRSEEAWAAARERLKESQLQVAEALRTRAAAEPMQMFLPHDAYHFGQINYIRAMLGLAAIE